MQLAFGSSGLFIGTISKAAIAPIALGLLLTATGCEMFSRDKAQAQPQSRQGQGQPGGAPAVETAIAATGALQEPLEYTGTTEPIRQVSLRSQVEGQLLNLTVDVGDRVTQGQVLAELNDRLLRTEVAEAQAELAARQVEIAQAQAEVSDTQAQAEQARVELEQSRADAARLQTLANDGAVTTQAAEQAQTEALAAEQVLRSAQQQVRTRQQAVLATERRARAQAAVVAQTQERRAYSTLQSPISGAVLERTTEPGNLVQPGNEILKLGDFSAIKVVVQVSERELGNIRLGRAVQVRLDAFPEQVISGSVTQISPAADPTARLIPIEITIPNREGQIGSGLLARVQFGQTEGDRLIVPQGALELGDEEGASTLFVIEGTGDQAKAIARRVQVGQSSNGQVEILSGLKVGETVAISSSGNLKDGQAVRLSILSETQSVPPSSPQSSSQ